MGSLDVDVVLGVSQHGSIDQQQHYMPNSIKKDLGSEIQRINEYRNISSEADTGYLLAFRVANLLYYSYT